jgi:hypothetical protein
MNSSLRYRPLHTTPNLVGHEQLSISIFVKQLRYSEEKEKKLHFQKASVCSHGKHEFFFETVQQGNPCCGKNILNI